MVNISKIAEDFVKDTLNKEGKKFEKRKDGCDIIVKNEDDNEIFIEVKGRSRKKGASNDKFVIISSYNTNKRDIKKMPDNWELWIVEIDKDTNKAFQFAKLSKNDVINMASEPRQIWEINYKSVKFTPIH